MFADLTSRVASGTSLILGGRIMLGQLHIHTAYAVDGNVTATTQFTRDTTMAKRGIRPNHEDEPPTVVVIEVAP
ncbi:hypothetical protein RRF57_009772 [Xylaria bambusicola]|uniref:Uncharacterized protein n=1 Tax=Xylaria bambusicola TaxID=326684 RepID=A0AAN7ZC61_9PEZI